MSSSNKLLDFLNILECPEPTLQTLSFCASKKPIKVKEWVDDLRATRPNETGAEIYQSLPELAILKTDYETRLAMLEHMRPSAQYVVDNLTRDIINLHLTASDAAQRKIIITQAIQKAMIDGYTRVVYELAQLKRHRPSTMTDLTIALHRAITGIGLVLMRNYQLYTQSPSDFWLRLHTLFQIADYFDLLAKPVTDNLLKSIRATNIQTAYTRALILDTAKLNQLSQKNVALVYEALETWSQYVRLHTASHQDKDLFYLVNLSADLPPCYKSRFQGKSGDRILQINFKVLVSLLSKLSSTIHESEGEDAAHGTLPLPVGFPDSLIDHLLHCWSGMRQRQQERRDVQGTAEIAIGLVNAHFYVCGKQEFNTFTGESSDSDDLTSSFSSGTPFSGLTANFGFDDELEEAQAPSVPTYEVHIQNVSAGGFCLSIKGIAPPRLQAGEVLGMKESGRHSWSIGVVRWIRHFKGGTQMGVQSLANHPKAFAVALYYDMGGHSDLMRAFFIPATKNGKTPASLLTANAPFKETDKIKIFDGDSEYKAKLNNSLFATGSVQQFLYQPTEPVKNPTQNRTTNKNFDNSWE